MRQLSSAAFQNEMLVDNIPKILCTHFRNTSEDHTVSTGGLIPGHAVWADDRPGEHPAALKLETLHVNSSWIYIRRQTQRSPPPYLTLSFSHSLSLSVLTIPASRSLQEQIRLQTSFLSMSAHGWRLSGSLCFSHNFLQLWRPKRRGRRKCSPRPPSTPRQHVLRCDLLSPVVEMPPSGPGWWKINSSDEESAGGEAEEEGGANGKRGEGQDPVGGVTDAGQLLCHRDSGEGEEEEGWTDTSLEEAAYLTMAASASTRVQPSACSHSSGFITARSQLLHRIV